jgi:hypothetical protein
VPRWLTSNFFSGIAAQVLRCEHVTDDEEVVHEVLSQQPPIELKIKTNADAKAAADFAAKAVQHSKKPESGSLGSFGYDAAAVANFFQLVARGLRTEPAACNLFCVNAARTDATAHLHAEAAVRLGELPDNLTFIQLGKEMNAIARDLANEFDRSAAQVRKKLPGLWKQIKNRRRET